MRELQNSIWGQICAFCAGFRFLASRLWPTGYVDLRETEPAQKSLNLAPKASFATPSNKRIIHGIEVYGLELNSKSGCAHYHSPLDIIAIKFKCCLRYFACRSCHDALTDHPVEHFTYDEFQEQAVLCGSCGAELHIAIYLTCNAQCPHCQALFNPGCKAHWDLYFKINSS